MINKINNLINALNAIGINAWFEPNARWYGTDGKIHVGMEISTDFFTGEDNLEFLFTHKGKFIRNCLEAPIQK